MTNQELESLYDKVRADFESLNALDLKAKSLFYSNNSSHIMVLKDKDFDVEKYIFSFSESCKLKEMLCSDFLKLEDFKKKYVFWQENCGSLTAINDLERLNKVIRGNDSNEKSSFRKEQEKIDSENGIVKPQPFTSEEKAFVANWHINQEVNRLKEDNILNSSIDILSFEGYLKKFISKLGNMINPKKYIEDELEEVRKYLNSYPFNSKIPKNLSWEYREYSGNPDKVNSLIESIYSMANNSYIVDYSELYEYIHHLGYIDYLQLALIISPIQYKVFLEKQLNEITKLGDSSYFDGIEKQIITIIENLEIEEPLLTNHSLKSNLAEISKGGDEINEDMSNFVFQNENQKIIYTHIKHLEGFNNFKEKIMDKNDFRKLFHDICYLVNYDKVPVIKKPLKQIIISNQSLIYTFRLIHKDIFTTSKIKDSFHEFLKKYFLQLNNRENIRGDLSKKAPKNYPF